jgi:hypothetical protein
MRLSRKTRNQLQAFRNEKGGTEEDGIEVIKMGTDVPFSLFIV